MPGPKPSPYSLKRTSVKKAFYIDKSAWAKLESYFKRTGKEKSHVVNEALQLYIEQMFNVSRVQSSHWSVVSLFSGCGGMDLGFSGGFNYLDTYYDGHQRHFGKKCDTAFKIIFANDILPEACQTYESYFRNKENDYQTIVRNEDIKEFLDRIELISKSGSPVGFPDQADVVVGGFPCQDFSVAGKRTGFDSERGRLYLQMKRVVAKLNPKIFIAENVKGLTNLGSALDVIKEDFSKTGIGYKIISKLHHAADFGVPQSRERVFIVGIRNDLDSSLFSFPLETHSIETSDTGLPSWITSKEAIHDLIKNNKVPNQLEFSKAKNYGSHCQGNKPIKADRPAPTIRAEHHGNIEFHYLEERRLTIRECARLQSFPDEMCFIAPPSKSYRLIGNAVPPVLAWHIGESVAKFLGAIRK